MRRYSVTSARKFHSSAASANDTTARLCGLRGNTMEIGPIMGLQLVPEVWSLEGWCWRMRCMSVHSLIIRRVRILMWFADPRSSPQRLHLLGQSVDF